MKIVFIGTGPFAVPILEALATDGHFSVGLVVSEPAKPAGRKRELRPSPVSIWAKKNDIPVITPRKLDDVDTQKEVLVSKPEVIVVVDYGGLIPEEIFNAPPKKTVNVHPSLLPELRGASPIQYALLKGFKKTGVSLMIIDEQFDHGPLISQDEISIEESDTYETLSLKLSSLGAEMIIRDLPAYLSGGITPEPQDDNRATFAKKIQKEDGRIDWHSSVKEIYNKWRAFVAWPGIFTFLGAVRLNLKKVKPARDNVEIGIIRELGGKLLIGCEGGSIEVLIIQPEGKRAMSAGEFINGYKNILNTGLR